MTDEEGHLPERALCLAVINQAAVDAAMNLGPYITIRSRHLKNANLELLKLQATRWLTGSSERFRLICDLAGLNPAYVREKAQDIINNKRLSKKGNRGWAKKRRKENGG